MTTETDIFDTLRLSAQVLEDRGREHKPEAPAKHYCNGRAAGLEAAKDIVGHHPSVTELREIVEALARCEPKNKSKLSPLISRARRYFAAYPDMKLTFIPTPAPPAPREVSIHA